MKTISEFETLHSETGIPGISSSMNKNGCDTKYSYIWVRHALSLTFSDLATDPKIPEAFMSREEAANLINDTEEMVRNNPQNFKEDLDYYLVRINELRRLFPDVPESTPS